MTWQSFISDHASAVFGLVGAFGAALLSFVSALLLKRRDTKVEIARQLLERRIAAHENIIALAVEMRVMAALGGEDENGQIRRAPQVLISPERFDSWFTRFTQLTMDGTTWLSTHTKREVNFAQDYLANLHMRLQSVPEQTYEYVGTRLRDDFIDISSALEKSAHRFFDRGVYKLKLDSLNKWHKHPRAVTQRRFQETAMVREWPDIEAKMR